MPDASSPDQVPPPPVATQQLRGRNRILLAGAAVGLVALAVVLLTLPTGEAPIGAAPTDVARAPAVSVTPSRAVPKPIAPTPTPVSVQPVAAPRIPPPPPTATEIITAVLPKGARVRLDGKSTSRRRFRVSAGRHILDVSAPGYLPRSDTVTLSAGQQFTWSPKLVAGSPTHAGKRSPKAVVSEPATRRSAVDDAACRQEMARSSWRDALASCLRAAQAGSAAAQRSVATLFQHGNGTRRSDDSAARWFAQAARNGDAEAMYQLAIGYEHGHGVKKDQAAALDWYVRAGNAGHRDAAYTVGDAYEKGHLGAVKDRSRALEWYRKAAALGSKDAANKVRDLQR